MLLLNYQEKLNWELFPIKKGEKKEKEKKEDTLIFSRIFEEFCC